MTSPLALPTSRRRGYDLGRLRTSPSLSRITGSSSTRHYGSGRVHQSRDQHVLRWRWSPHHAILCSTTPSKDMSERGTRNGGPPRERSDQNCRPKGNDFVADHQVLVAAECPAICHCRCDEATTALILLDRDQRWRVVGGFWSRQSVATPEGAGDSPRITQRRADAWARISTRSTRCWAARSWGAIR